MDDRVLDIAEDLYFHYTNKNIESSELVPYYTSDDLAIVKEFCINKTYYTVGETNQETGIQDKRIAILTDCITFCPQLRNSISDKHAGRIVEGDTALSLINNHIIHPFMLFINGRFVKWTDVRIYKDMRYQVIVVDSDVEYVKEDQVVEAQVLQLPITMITYIEDGTVIEDQTQIFGFDKDGYLEVSGDTKIYLKSQELIGYIQLLLPGGNIEEDDIQVPDECQLYPSNVIIFKDNMIYPNPKIEISPYNTMTVDDGVTIGLEYKMFYDKRVNTPYNNVSQIINHDYLKHTYLNTEPNPEWLNILHQKFDYDFDTSKSYDENIEAFSEYLLNYNYREVINRVKSSNVYSFNKYIGDYADKSNVLIMYPKDFTYSLSGYMLFINGVLCNSIAREYSYGIKLDLSRYSDDSILEFIAFQNCIDESETITIDTSDPDRKYFNGFWSFGNDFDLFCDRHPDEIFNILERDKVLYKIDPSQYTVSKDGISFSEFYTSYNHTIIRVPRVKFGYERFVIEKTEDFNVHLKTFDRFEDPNKYMVFVNGYRINSTLYRVIVPSPTLPFIDQAIYFNIILNKGDVVEVFYTPMSILDEVNIDNLDHSTISGTGIDQLGFITGPTDLPVPISRDLHLFFVNGIKIPKDYLMDISYNMTRIVVNMKSIENLCLIGFDNNIIEFFESLNLSPSILDSVYDAHDKMGINILTNTYTAVTNTSPMREKEITDHALINEIIRYYYGPVNYGTPFRYDYDSSVYAEVDAAGNIVIDVMDASPSNRVNLQLKE